MTAWKKYPGVESELFNVHGLNNKISIFADARAAYANQQLNNIAVQDDLDDNTYEYVRRYLALTNFVGGILPMPYDPRHLLLRRPYRQSPIRPTFKQRSTRFNLVSINGFKPSAGPSASAGLSTT